MLLTFLREIIFQHQQGIRTLEIFNFSWLLFGTYSYIGSKYAGGVSKRGKTTRVWMGDNDGEIVKDDAMWASHKDNPVYFHLTPLLHFVCNRLFIYFVFLFNCVSIYMYFIYMYIIYMYFIYEKICH